MLNLVGIILDLRSIIYDDKVIWDELPILRFYQLLLLSDRYKYAPRYLPRFFAYSIQLLDYRWSALSIDQRVGGCNVMFFPTRQCFNLFMDLRKKHKDGIFCRFRKLSASLHEPYHRIYTAHAWVLHIAWHSFLQFFLFFCQFVIMVTTDQSVTCHACVTNLCATSWLGNA